MNKNRMKHYYLFIIFLLSVTSIEAQVKIITWNVQSFGRSKLKPALEFMAEQLNDCDVIAIQNILTGKGGAEAVSRLRTELNKKGSEWDYVVSDPTSNPGDKLEVERYAFLWKPDRVQLVGKPWLDPKYANQIIREPYYATFSYEGNEFIVANFNALPKEKLPESEIKYFKFIPKSYPGKNIIFLGSFNLPQSHIVFTPLKEMKYEPVIKSQKTILRNECVRDDCLSAESDNIFYNTSKIKMVRSGVILFHEKIATMRETRELSDHIPVWFEFQFKK